MTLRDYQVRALDGVRDAYRQGHESVVMVLPTGAGKTTAFSAAIHTHIQTPGRRALVICHRRELIAQAAATLRRLGLTCIATIVAGGWEGPRDARVVVASVDSLRASGEVPDATLVVWDEAHHAVAESWSAVRALCRPGARHLLVTATPQRLDGRPMGDVATAIVVGIQVPDLIDQGHLVDVDVYAPGRSLDARQHAQSAWDAYPAGKRGVVFAPDRRYSAETVAGLRARGIRSEHLDGAMRSPWRAEVLRRLAAGELDVVSNVGLLAEGWDLPALEVAVVARSCHSAALWLQICGRVMRPHPGKTKGTIIDLVGAVHRHGLPSMRREFSLDGDGVSSPSDRMALQQCSSCGAVWVRNGTPHCPQCGAGQSLRERDPIAFAGERLERITAAQQANAAKGEEYMMGLLKQFMAVARERGYNPGWARYQVAQKTGLKPSWAQVNACR